MTENDDSTRAFQPLGKFKHPAMPADQSIRRSGAKLWRVFLRRPQDEVQYIADDSLVGADRDELDELVAPPACGPLLRELTEHFADILAHRTRKGRIHVVVLPPCDRNDVLRTWATQHKLTILEPPARDSLMNHEIASMPLNSETAGPIVIPRLERWFLRHPSGLHRIRLLLTQLTRSDQSFIVGCNSWAWRFLAVAVQADLLLPGAVTFQAFPAERLQKWLAELAISDDVSDSVFRLASNGGTLVGVDVDTKIADNYFATLAARSLGIPWIAWLKWRRSLRLGHTSSDSPSHELAEHHAVWVTELEEFHLPNDEVDAALLTLQSLLIHDSLTDSELDLTTPHIRRSGAIASLLKLGLIARLGDAYCCAPAAYPAIRERLAAAGFPLDQL